MTCLDIAKQYLDAWNAHDVDAIVKTFADDGTYCDPTTGEISGDAIGANAKRLWDAFPDLSFEIVSLAEAGASRVVAEWIMKGTNTGVFQGLPATGRSISLPGIDVIEIDASGIKAVKGYFDTRAVPDQLGLQVLVQPFTVGPFSFGNSISVQSGKKAKPGAFGITTIWNDDAQTEEIRAMTRATATEMLRMEGFIGVSFFRIGGRGVTISAWEKPEHTKQLMRGGAHSEAMRKFWAELGDAAFTSVWVPDHINPLWVRCTVCRKMNDYKKNSGACNCGQRLPEAPFHTPVFVLTHEQREPWVRPGGTTFYFVQNGPECALELAREAVGERDIRISGGADVIQQYLNLGAVDELEIALVPVLFGGGRRLFENLREPLPQFRIDRVIDTPAATHLRYVR